MSDPSKTVGKVNQTRTVLSGQEEGSVELLFCLSNISEIPPLTPVQALLGLNYPPDPVEIENCFIGFNSFRPVLIAYLDEG